MTNFQERFLRELRLMLEETFEHVHGTYLDRGTSLGETLAQIPAEQASQTVVRQGNSIVAHVIHLTFYLDLLERVLRGEDVGKIDWEETWRITQATPVEWEQMQAHLKQTYQTILATLARPDIGERDDAIGDAMAMVVHTAYHLGAIRQMILITA